MRKYLFPLVSVVCIFVGILIGNLLSGSQANAMTINWANVFGQSKKVDQLLMYMQSSYVDEIQMDSLTEKVMDSFVKELDPHSAYIPAKDLEMVNSQLGSSFSGIGVQFNIQQDTIHVVAVISGGPCEGLGVLAGDKIISVNDTNFTGKGINNEKVMHKLRGPKGTKVKLGIKRSGVGEVLNFTITRGDIPVTSVDAKFMVAPKIGFVRVNKFGENTYQEFMDALSYLTQAGAQKFIIDLRENSGGYMEQAIRMANEFLSLGDMIVYAEGRAYPRYEAKADGMGRFKSVPLVVLIDEFSASASEIFAGAMQDNDRALVVGRRSFGKGLVQQQVPFSDGSALRLTVARYYTPAGRCIQKPYKLGDGKDYEKDLLERFERGEFYSQDSIHMNDSVVYLTKKGRKVYGGGGIMPDVFVGRDTSLNTPYYNQIVNRGFTYQFAYKYTDDHRAELKKYTTWQELEQHLRKQDVVGELTKFVTAKDVKLNEEQLVKSRPLLERLVVAYVVRNMLNDAGFFPLFERDDEVTKRAVEELNKQ